MEHHEEIVKKHGADCRFCLVDNAVTILQQRAPPHGTPRQQPDNGDSGVLAGIALTIGLEEREDRHVQFFRRPEEILGRKENILPVNAALAAFRTAELERRV